MATETKNKKMLIKGAGKFMAKIPDCDELITCGTLNNMRLDIQLDMQDIEGGDSSVPLDTLLRKKTIDITAEDAKFDLNMLRLVLGSKLKEGVTGAPYKIVSEVITLMADADSDGNFEATLSQAPSTGAGIPAVRFLQANGVAVDPADITLNGLEVEVDSTTGLVSGSKLTAYIPVAIAADKFDADGYVWVLEEKHVIENSKITLAFGGQLAEEKSVAIRGLRSNKLMKRVTTAPAENQYKIGTGGEIEFHISADKTDIYVNYKRFEVVDVLDIATKDFPLTVSVVHDGAFEQKDGTIQAYQTELYTCRVKSNFTLDAQRQQASTHSVTLTVIDSERVDGKLGTIKRYEITNTNLADIC